jgi:hypothetical protein
MERPTIRPTIRPRVFFEFTIGHQLQQPERIVIELFTDKVPQTCEKQVPLPPPAADS